MTQDLKNPWTSEDEREHPTSVMEWWCLEAFFKSQEDNKQWSLKTAMVEWFEHKTKIGSLINTTLFDQDTNKHFIYFSRDDTKRLQSAKDRFHVKYANSSMKGIYPNYETHIDDPENNIKLDLQYHGESLPHWVAHDVTRGWLPMGSGFYRYGFIPKGTVNGTMQINKKLLHLKGIGYYEHVWGNFSYSSPLRNLLSINKTLFTYIKLIGWWLTNHKPAIPKSITFGSENNPFGYDWAWVVLDNGWTIFYGNILLWIMQGPAAGSLTLSKDGKHYTEFCNVHFTYTKTRYSKEYDFYYPSELEITAIRGKEQLQLTLTMTAESREYISRFSEGSYWIGLAVCESPGTARGYYTDGTTKIPLNGICKIEPQRQIPIIGHNTLQIDFHVPPKQLGVSFDFTSHRLRKKLLTTIQLIPRPKITYNLNRLDASKIHTNKI
jgi:hypothetical protein